MVPEPWEEQPIQGGKGYHPKSKNYKYCLDP